jgi:SAM-dependent methyltransferase
LVDRITVVSDLERLGDAVDLRRFCAGIIAEPSPFDEMMINEAAFGLSRVREVLKTRADPASRLLEVGAGHLILSSYLACRGFDMTAVEPLTDGFESFSDLHSRMAAYATSVAAPLTVLGCAIEAIDARDSFDVVFCVNALEHMKDPFTALDVMHRATRPGGVVVVHCPNYDVPFDSHLGIVLITLNKRVNGWFYRDRIARRQQCWDGLTFIRHSALRRHFAAKGYRVVFNTRMMEHAVVRLVEDPVFFARMPRPLRAAAQLLAQPRVAAALGRLPLRLQTPMEFVLSK